ncbi:hypothetical protein K440DRAFT_72128 [Wilcoxina mikolae CBS 423.85]|nr:hypothetical protein K440DRAFT_72128 [Wilcoxina mikolae CBS 423.85]
MIAISFTMSTYIFNPPPSPPPPALPPQLTRFPRPIVSSPTDQSDVQNMRGDTRGERNISSTNFVGQYNWGRKTRRGNQAGSQKQPPCHFQPSALLPSLRVPAAPCNQVFSPQIHPQAQQRQHPKQLPLPFVERFQHCSVPIQLQPILSNSSSQSTSISSQPKLSTHHVRRYSQILRSYSDLSPATAPTSYAHFSANSQRLPKLCKTDMSQDEWLALNGGKLLGTNIYPPETEHEIADWIAKRKERFPTAKKNRQSVQKDKDQIGWCVAEENYTACEKNQHESPKIKPAVEQNDRIPSKPVLKRKRNTVRVGDIVNSESDSTPEEFSAHLNSVCHDYDNKQSTLNLNHIFTVRCHLFGLNGSCRCPTCKSSHNRKTRSLVVNNKHAMDEQSKLDKSQRCLYQRIAEKEMDCENELILHMIKSFAKCGDLKHMLHTIVKEKKQSDDCSRWVVGRDDVMEEEDKRKSDSSSL